ncbi:MAG TPA: serine--tRNA ligase [Abditibacteriaceae bacterium]|nr:serine--tRNA ligase [Abditibacteriaceae bacterium]
MLDIKFIRHNTEFVKACLVHRQIAEGGALLDAVLHLDERRRSLLVEVEQLKRQRNEGSQQVARLKKNGEDASQLIAETRHLGDRITALDLDGNEIELTLERKLLELPNIHAPGVPVGADEEGNVVMAQEGEPRAFDFVPRPHWELGEALDIIDFERGVKLSGSRFYVLKGAGAKLQRALIQWLLDLHVEQGYREVYTPFIVKEQCMVGARQLPKFRDNLYRDVEDDLWLVPTAEVPITNLHRDEILSATDLPLQYCAYTPCFRREKMSAGRDVRGIKRGHQFDKVEMYKFVRPETSYDELEKMRADAEDTCRRLQIPFRTKELCTGDLGFGSTKTYDIELWAPGQDEWLEVSSCSNTEAFQARATNVRFRPEAGAKPEFVHTLNGSGLGVPRTMIAILENYQNADGSVTVPDVLRSYVGGLETIGLSDE